MELTNLINEILENNKAKEEITLKKNDINTILSWIKHKEDLLNQALKDYDELLKEHENLLNKAKEKYNEKEYNFNAYKE